MTVQSTHPATRAHPSTLSTPLLALMQLAGTWLGRIRSRNELAMLRPDQMRDVGLDPIAVRREANKPFWEA